MVLAHGERKESTSLLGLVASNLVSHLWVGADCVHDGFIGLFACCENQHDLFFLQGVQEGRNVFEALFVFQHILVFLRGEEI